MADYLRFARAIVWASGGVVLPMLAAVPCSCTTVEQGTAAAPESDAAADAACVERTVFGVPPAIEDAASLPNYCPPDATPPSEPDAALPDGFALEGGGPPCAPELPA